MSANHQAKINQALTDISIGAPFVIANRVARMMVNDPTSRSQINEVTTMVTEKQKAAMQSMAASYQSGMEAWLKLGTAFWTGKVMNYDQVADAYAKVAEASLAPFSKRVNSNVRRYQRAAKTRT